MHRKLISMKLAKLSQTPNLNMHKYEMAPLDSVLPYDTLSLL